MRIHAGLECWQLHGIEWQFARSESNRNMPMMSSYDSRFRVSRSRWRLHMTVVSLSACTLSVCGYFKVDANDEPKINSMIGLSLSLMHSLFRHFVWGMQCLMHMLGFRAHVPGSALCYLIVVSPFGQKSCTLSGQSSLEEGAKQQRILRALWLQLKYVPKCYRNAAHTTSM